MVDDLLSGYLFRKDPSRRETFRGDSCISSARFAGKIIRFTGRHSSDFKDAVDRVLSGRFSILIRIIYKFRINSAFIAFIPSPFLLNTPVFKSLHVQTRQIYAYRR